MKKTVLAAFGALLSVVSLHSCLDFDMPTDTFTGGDTELDPIVYKGKADSIDYRKEILEEGFAFAEKELNNYFFQLQTVQYCMRGGKEGQLPGAHQYQYVYNITVDNYAGYLCVPHNFSHGGDGILSSTYYYNRGYCDGPYGAFLMVKNNLVNMLNHPHIDSIPEMKAIGLLLYNYSAQEMVDLYGSIPYVDHKNNKETNPFTFNKMADIYETIVDNLDTINACLKHYEQRPGWYKSRLNGILQQSDWVTKDFSIDTWRRFANSLKLRMAMHIVKVDRTKAQKWAQEAVTEGVIETENQEIALDPVVSGFTHPLVDISKLWGDSRLNASFESLLFSLKHPYVQDDYALFEKNSSQIVNETNPEEIEPTNSRIVGLRAGISMVSGQTVSVNPRIAYSAVSSNRISMAPLYLMKLSEVQFLRAEGAVRNWAMGGSAQSFYEAGIRSAQLDQRTNSQYGEKVDEYMSVEEPVAYAYTDPMDHTNDIASVTKIGVKWNEGDTPETKLEKIITQKYIANFPMSAEAWTTFRRTGYPRIFPVDVNNMKDQGVDTELQLRRIPIEETANNTLEIASLVQALGQPNTGASRVFWDKQTETRGDQSPDNEFALVIPVNF